MRHKVIAEIQAVIESVSKPLPEATPEDLLESAQKARNQIDAGELLRRDAEPAFEAALDDLLDKKRRKHGVDAEGNPLMPPADEETLRKAHRALHGSPALTLGFQAERYMSQVSASALRRQSVLDKQRHLDSFLDWAGRDTECKKISKTRASAFVDDVVMPRKASPQTKRVAINEVRQFFDWLDARDLVPFNPFSKTGKLLKDSTRGKEQPHRPWTNEELLTVLKYIPQDDPMWPMAALAAYTGARREDICTLKKDSVDGDCLVIREGKTAAAVRRIPIHPTIKPLVTRLAASGKEKYLIPGLLSGGNDAKLGHLVGKRFGYAIRKAGVDDPRVVYHSFRNSVLTQMEAAGVDLALRQQVVGHVQNTVTERAYTAPASEKRRADALKHITYGKTVDSLVRTVGKSIEIKRFAKRRPKKHSD